MEKRIKLYRDMADLTAPECGKSCRIPHSCCSAEYCESAIKWAKTQYGVTLEPTNNHPKLPLMGPTGCTAEPHFRPMCTLHTCAISSFGVKPNDQEWTDKYFTLRAKIDVEEYKHYRLNQKKSQ